MKRRLISKYYEVFVPDHPMAKIIDKCGWVMEHRYVMSEHLGGVVLTSNDVVHHKDGNRHNNDIENLELTNQSDHAKEHMDKNMFVVCACCGKSFHIKPSMLNKKRGKYCSRECSDVSGRKVERPSKDQLIEDLHIMPYTKVGIKYGVSDNAVRKWAKAYGIL